MDAYDELDQDPGGLLGLIDQLIGPDPTVSDDAMRSIGPGGTAPSPEPEDDDLFGEIIHAYSRADAIADGTLVEVDEAVRQEAGFRYPLALTAAAWADAVEWDEQDSRRQTYQDESGRLWDVLTMARHALRRGGQGDRARFEVLRVPRGGRARMARSTYLVVHIGPGDTPEPVLTIMQPGED